MEGIFVIMFIQFQTLSHADEYQTRTYDMTTRDFDNAFIVWGNWGFLKRKRAVDNRKVVREVTIVRRACRSAKDEAMIDVGCEAVRIVRTHCYEFKL
jgi:hypothetical protein